MPKMPHRQELSEFEKQHKDLTDAGMLQEAAALAESFSKQLSNSKRAAESPPASAEDTVRVEKIGFAEGKPASHAVEGEFQISGSGVPESWMQGNFLPDPTASPGAPSSSTSPPSPPPTTGSADESSTGFKTSPTECPHCGWAYGRPDIEATEADKIDYEMAVVTDTAFERSYSTIKDKLSFRFRDLSIAELDLCSRQAKLDVDKGRVSDNIAAMEMMQRYQLVLSVVRIQMGPNVLEFPPSVQAWEAAAEAGETKLPGVLSIFSEKVKTATVYRILSMHFSRFRQLVRKLEDNNDNNPFWNETGSVV